MTTLLVPLVGPLQSWGLDARFGIRDTGPEPSKSGVLGLVCAALGLDRSEPITDLCGLRFGVRVDREGTLIRDFQTAQEVPAAGNRNNRGTVVSQRWYLADAAFLAAFQGEQSLLERVHRALSDPVWPVFLGRKACVPSMPLHLADGLVEGSIEETFRGRAPLVDPGRERGLRVVIEDPEGDAIRPDQPVGPFSERRFTHRTVRTEVFPWNSRESS